MKRFFTVFLAVLTAFTAAGCIQEQVTQTLYISPSGLVWSVLEKDVRSDESELAKRVLEEQKFVLAADAGTHGPAEFLRTVGAQSVKTTWLRRERPYTLMTEGRFTDLRQLALAVLRDSKVGGDATLAREGCQTRFTLDVDLTTAPDESPKDGPLGDLLEDLKNYRIVLTEGHFVSADGFDIGDGMIAVPDAKKKVEGGTLRLALVWADDGCPAK